MFISCDWGTSALRLRLVDTSSLNVLAESTTPHGISPTYESWKKNGKRDDQRLSFYQSVLADQIMVLEHQTNSSLKDIPIVISGMASSSIGMIELPYRRTPFHMDGHDLIIETVDASPEFNHATLIISGVKTDDDAMRGEETQLIGCIDESGREEQLFIVPGTHSKHVTVRNEKVIDVKTYMTGELFELLSRKSILANDVDEENNEFSTDELKNFEKGVSDSQQQNLLHNIFLVRTNTLFNKLTKHENYYYLSGLLIGAELKEIKNSLMPLTIVGEERLIKYYTAALNQLGLHSIRYLDAGKAVIRGQFKLYTLHQSKLTPVPTGTKPTSVQHKPAL